MLVSEVNIRQIQCTWNDGRGHKRGMWNVTWDTLRLSMYCVKRNYRHRLNSVYSNLSTTWWRLSKSRKSAFRLSTRNVTFYTSVYPAKGRLLLAPTALGGARFIRYTVRLELATVVLRALARCRLSKSHHRPARVARASSAVAPVPFLNRILCRNRQFCTVFRIFTH